MCIAINIPELTFIYSIICPDSFIHIIVILFNTHTPHFWLILLKSTTTAPDHFLYNTFILLSFVSMDLKRIKSNINGIVLEKLRLHRIHVKVCRWIEFLSDSCIRLKVYLHSLSKTLIWLCQFRKHSPNIYSLLLLVTNQCITGTLKHKWSLYKHPFMLKDWL